MGKNIFFSHLLIGTSIGIFTLYCIYLLMLNKYYGEAADFIYNPCCKSRDRFFYLSLCRDRALKELQFNLLNTAVFRLKTSRTQNFFLFRSATSIERQLLM